MSCIHVWVQRGKNNHLALETFNVVHLLNDNGNSPHPVGVDKEETVQ
jgi:hypothetical protein